MAAMEMTKVGYPLKMAKYQVNIKWICVMNWVILIRDYDSASASASGEAAASHVYGYATTTKHSDDADDLVTY